MNHSNSAINEFSRCPLSYFYRYEQHLRRIDEDKSAHHTTFGTAGHKAFEVLYTEGDVKRAQQAMRDYYPVQLDPEDLAKTADNACFAITKYWQHYNMDRDWQVVSVERRDATDDGFGIKPDLVVKDAHDNLLVVDHKFTGAYLNYDWFSQFDPNSQVTHYIRWCKEKYGHCDGFVVNAISLRHRQRAYKGEAAGFWCAFERQQFQRTASQIENTVRSADEVIEDIARAQQRGFWRAAEHKQACHFCSYKSLCSAGWSWQQDRELILSVFKQTCDEPVSATDEHCTLDLGHSGPHSSAIQQASVVEFEVSL